MKKVLLSILIAGSFFACKKDSDSPTPVPTPTPTPVAAYYIEGKVDGVMYRAEYVCPFAGCAEIGGYYDQFMGWVSMQRTMSSTNEIGWFVQIDNVSDIDAWIVPDTLDASSDFGQENLQLSFYDGPWQSDNNYLVDGVILGDNSFQMVVTSKTNDIIEATFHGELRNGTTSSDTKTVTDGKLRIKLVRT